MFGIGPVAQTTLATLCVVALIVIGARLFANDMWRILDLARPAAEAIGRSLERAVGHPLPPASSYDILGHGLLLAGFSLYVLAVLILQDTGLIRHLPIMIYLFFGYTIVSFAIATILERVQ